MSTESKLMDIAKEAVEAVKKSFPQKPPEPIVPKPKQ